METHVSFDSGGIVLEGLLERKPGMRGVIITHPHSLYGGDMHNVVVESAQKVYAMNGFTTLRFNFRGVGASGGVFDNGIGEGSDVLSAVQYCVDVGITILHLVGYSFGARVIGGIETLPPQIISESYIAPPVAFMDYSAVGKREKLQFVIVGDEDDFAPVDLVRSQLETWNADIDLVVIEGASHFFGPYTTQLEQHLSLFLADS